MGGGGGNLGRRLVKTTSYKIICKQDLIHQTCTHAEYEFGEPEYESGEPTQHRYEANAHNEENSQ